MNGDTPNLTTLYQGALDVAYQNPLLYQIDVQAEQAETAHANNLEYWKTIYPKAELRAIDNPGVDYRLFGMPWQQLWGNPPLVFLNVTPRKKELPKTSGALQTAALFAPVIALIPFVGTVAAIALSVASAADQKGRISKFLGAMASVTASQFEPQYYPEPFPVLLPLDWAQLAVRDPWRLPSLWDAFSHRIQEAQREATQALMGATSTLTLSPEVNARVVNVGAPGSLVSEDDWYDNLLASFGRMTDPGLEYQRLQNTWQTGNPEGDPLQGMRGDETTAPEKSNAVLWLALLGGAALIAGN